jgi:hypothetical protein
VGVQAWRVDVAAVGVISEMKTGRNLFYINIAFQSDAQYMYSKGKHFSSRSTSLELPTMCIHCFQPYYQAYDLSYATLRSERGCFLRVTFRDCS